MARLEQMNKLNPTTVALSGRIGGIPQYTAADVNAALAFGKLGKLASLYCRVKYLYHQPSRRPLERGVYVGPVLDLAVAQKWQGVVGTIPRMVNLALDEMLSNGICQHCRGTGKEMDKGQLRACTRCENASGRESYSQRRRARALAMDHKNFVRSWAGRYADVMAIYESYEIEVADALDKLG